MSVTFIVCNFHEVGYFQKHSLHRTNLDKKFFLLNFSRTCTKYEDLQASAGNFSDSVEIQEITERKLYIRTGFSQSSEVSCKIGDLKNIKEFTRNNEDAITGVLL